MIRRLFFTMVIAVIPPAIAQNQLNSTGAARSPLNRYILILKDPAVSSAYKGSEAVHSPAAAAYRTQLQSTHDSLSNELRARNIQITGSVSTLLNAVFVNATDDRLPELRNLPGVAAVLPARPFHRHLNAAAKILDIPAAVNAVGGAAHAGAGIKIGIIDTGIDLSRPAFSDKSFSMPAGYPICSGGTFDCQSYTNNKVIVARSYVQQLAMGSDPNNPAADSRPDDYTPRDFDGHGTMVATAAAGGATAGAVSITGVAPAAYLGVYKIYGSDEIYSRPGADVVIQAIEDAFADHMDVVNFSSGGSAFTGPLDPCDTSADNCDPVAIAFENAAESGMVVVASAGNSGATAFYPTFNSIASPADAPSVIAVGATTNSHYFTYAVRVRGSGVPANLLAIDAFPGDSLAPYGATLAPLIDVATIGNDGRACVPLRAGSLAGAFAVIENDGPGNCVFFNKVFNAVNAGAVGVVLYMADSSQPVNPVGLYSFDQPVVMIANSDGLALKKYIDAHPNTQAAIAPAGKEQQADTFNQLAFFSSLGPSTGASAIKPDLVAVGSDEFGAGFGVYMATQTLDPMGELYSADGFMAADGTSFSAPLTAGVAALIKQQHGTYSTGQVMSALANTATQDVTMSNFSTSVDIQSLGAGKLEAANAVNANITATVAGAPVTTSGQTLKPTTASLSFGALTSKSLPQSQQITVTDAGSTAVQINATVMPGSATGFLNPSLDKQSFSVPPNGSATLTATLSGSVPAPGSYSGFVVLQGSGVLLNIPYLYLVGDGVPANLISIEAASSGNGYSFDGTIGEQPDDFIAVKLVDQYGVPIANAPVSFTPRYGASFAAADISTDAYGIAAAFPVLGIVPGLYAYTAVAGDIELDYFAFARVQPTIAAGGIVNSASFDATVSPGSYITVYGSGLSDTYDSPKSAILPAGLDAVEVSFDVPGKISVPGRLVYVSPGQINLQVPWELQGETSAQVKVGVSYTSNSNVLTIPIVQYSPAFFEAGTNAVAALDLSYRLIDSSNPAHAGQIVQLFANGLGPVSHQPASGSLAPASPLAQTLTTPLVTIGGVNADVQFSGLTPGLAGLYQINVTVPANAGAGNVPITLSIGGANAKASSIYVQ